MFLRAILLLTTTFPLTLLAYPQMIRHGYNNCTTCHVSPRGGGMPTDYGRALSKELLSTWSYEGEEQWDYGAIDEKPDWFKLGGDFRTVQVHTRNQRGTMGRYIIMQEQVEAALKHKNSYLNITAGSDTLKESRPWYIPQFYFYTNLTDHLNMRVGRFVPRFGVNTPEHIFSTRGPLGFGFQSERDTLEFMYIQNKWDVSLAVVTGELRNKTEAQGFYTQINYSFSTKEKIGISIEKQTRGSEDLSLSMHGLVGFTDKLYLITDSVYRNSESVNNRIQEGFFHFSKIGWEMEKGFHFILIEDLKKQDLQAAGTTEFLYGGGFVFFPRPHLEIQGVLAKQRVARFESGEGEYAWLMLHFYL